MIKSFLVTRAAHQAGGQLKAIQAMGFEALLLPTMRILLQDCEVIEDLVSYDWAIIISPNAAWSLSNRWINYLRSRNIKLISMGAATTQILVDRGLQVSYTAPAGYGSEALVDIDSLYDVFAKKILIIKGEGGLDHIERTLTLRGAQVDNLLLYKRVMPTYTSARLFQIFSPWLAGGRDKNILLSSKTSCDYLLAIWHGTGLIEFLELKKIKVIVPSPRLQTYVRTLGFENVQLAASARDADMLAST